MLHLDKHTLVRVPPHFEDVRYVSDRIPGVADDDDLTLGANCQLFAYCLLRQLGKNPPELRSSELWSDRLHTEEVTELRPLDLMLYNNTAGSYGAHVAVYVGGGVVYHLSKKNDRPKYEAHTAMLMQPEYAFFIGAKRVKEG